MFSTPILAKIAVSAAKTADRAAHTCQDERPFVFMTLPISVEREFSGYEDLMDHDRESANSLNCNPVPRLTSAGLSPSRSSWPRPRGTRALLYDLRRVHSI